MKFTQKATQKKEKFHNLHGKKKLQYIWDYYKLHLIGLCILLYIAGYITYRHFTHKEILLYTALVNVSASESLSTQLSTDFLVSLETDTDKYDFQLYTGLYLTSDESNPYHAYTYMSRIKILAAIENKQMDVILMNKEAFDAFSQNGYLCNLKELLSSSDFNLYKKLEPCLVTNIVILEDMEINQQFDSAAEHMPVTEYPMGLDMSMLEGVIQKAGFEDTVYLGIIENSPRKNLSVDYIKYLFSENAAK